MSEQSLTKDLALNIRKHAVRMTSLGGSSHIGSILSISDILAVLYGEILKYNPSSPNWEGRDRFILSKGHAGAGVYAALAESGFFDTKLLDQHYQDGSIFSGHVSHKGVPGIEFSTGSLGHGLPVASGMAKAAKIDKKNYRVFVLMSDGECDEGSNWEAALFAPHHQLDNLVVTIDYNKLQSMKSTQETLALEPFADKWKSFGWNVLECDGHDHKALSQCFSPSSVIKNMPTCIITHTTKGKGVSFMENNVLWHYRSPQGDEYIEALRLLEEDK